MRAPLDLGPQISSSDDEKKTFDRSRTLQCSPELYHVVVGLVKAMMGEKAASDGLIRDIAYCYSLLILVKYALFSPNQATVLAVFRGLYVRQAEGRIIMSILCLWFFFSYVYDLLPTIISRDWSII